MAMSNFVSYNETLHGEVNSVFRKDRKDLFVSGSIFLFLAVALLIAAIIMFSLNDFNFGLIGTNTINPFTGIGYFLLFAFFFPAIPALLMFPKGLAFRKALKNKADWMVTVAIVSKSKMTEIASQSWGDSSGSINGSHNYQHGTFRQTSMRYHYTDGQGRARKFRVRVRFLTTLMGEAGDEVYLALSGNTPILLAVKTLLDTTESSNIKPKKAMENKAILSTQSKGKQSISEELIAMHEYLNDIKQFGLNKSTISPLTNETIEETLARDIKNTELFILHLEMKDGDVDSKAKLENMARSCKDAEYYLNADIGF